MKENHVVTKIFVGILCLLGILYFVIQGTGFYSNSVTTTLAYTSSMEKINTVSGYVVRNEIVLPSKTTGILSLLLDEGEHVGVNQEIALSFQDTDAQKDRQTLERLNQQLEQLQYAKDVIASAEIALRLDSTILSTINELQSNLSYDKLASSSDIMKELKSLIMKRDFPANAEEEINAELEKVSQSITDLQNKLRFESSSIKAEKSGYFSAVVDGYESLLTSDFTKLVTVSDYQKIAPDVTVSSNIGKMIYGSTWYFITMVDESDRLLYPVNSTLTIRFPKNSDREYTVHVDRVSDESNGKCVVVLSCNTFISELTMVRDISAEYVVSTYTGIRVPSSALHMSENGQVGIYCVIGKSARFKPVDLVYSSDNYYLVKPAEGVSSTLTIRNGDEIIVSASNLYDGKVVA